MSPRAAGHPRFRLRPGATAMIACLALSTACERKTEPDEGPSAASQRSAAREPPRDSEGTGGSAPFDPRGPSEATGPSSDRRAPHSSDSEGSADRAGSEPKPSAMTSGSGECTVLAGPRPLWPRPVAVTLAAAGSAVIAAGFDGDGASKQLFLLRVPRSGAPVEIARTPGSLRAKTAPPALLALESGKAWLAFVDRKGTLKAADLDPGRPVRSVPFREIASGVDSRFAPALVEETSGRRIAWTATGETMTIRVARMRPDGTVLRVEDPTPPAMGGTAPLFVAGAPRPVLLFVDARAGISPLLRLEDGDVAEIARPLGSLTEPPVLAAVHSSGGVLHVAYTAIGGAATTAIALARLDAEHTSPTALVPGTAYGPLSLAALAVGSRALFALEAPVDGGPGEAREIRLVGVDAAGSTPLAVLPGREGHAHAPSMARLEDGALAIAYRTSETVELTVLHCP